MGFGGNKEERLRREGMAYALDVAKKRGLEECERDLKMRGATQMPLSMPKKAVDEAVERIRNCTLDTVLILTLVTLRDEFGFGEKRLRQFMKRFDSKTDCLTGDFATWQDMKDILSEECNIHLEIRANDEDVKVRKEHYD